ncbi:MAG: hypothetical protein A3A24_00560 [Candidatus Buchananbacteria bacterium RIFCSPLOWO2_01_FULL_46_12]|uniref:SprT-like domain-containing protein n=2 Tax=Candidatus Buchananiibacteriota TaxID=1817903 RepID=A0A1G1YQA1_9BACT|nr:MAG: hypothetical protein A2744_03870 [Candidatus Buchananbacteria bacterium RIFCSPHIGHO2_01_FULL_44_11]OGY53810.1 MAG: hypothetical protein A3A24_00560 [Candidatus Buchananbacteria bacterium RIFCSPLOWO2_01_FULL_46_12]
MLQTANYVRSNKIIDVNVPINIRMIDLVKYLLEASTVSDRQKLGEMLSDELSDAAMINIVNLKISDTHQFHKRSGGRVVFKQYGYYRPKSKYIYIQNKTAVRGQTLAAKTFVDTLLHEWLHHYDTYKLKLNSIHTKGFYLRLQSLKEKLKLI